MCCKSSSAQHFPTKIRPYEMFLFQKQKCALQISAQWNQIAFCARTPSQWILVLSIFIHRRCGVFVTQCALVPGYFEIFSAIHSVFGNKRPLYMYCRNGNGKWMYTICGKWVRKESKIFFFGGIDVTPFALLFGIQKVQGWTNSISNRLDSFKQISFEGLLHFTIPKQNRRK